MALRIHHIPHINISINSGKSCHVMQLFVSHTAPERGPDFWRILQDDPYRNQTNVTLLFEVHKLKI